MGSLSLTQVLRQVRSGAIDSDGGLWGDLNAVMADAFCCILEFLAVSEVEKRTGVRYRERDPEQRKDHRNGYRRRQVQTTYATVTIKIPRLRGGGFIPSFLEPGRRAIEAVECWVEQAFLCGLSRIEIIRLMERTTGCRPSEGLLRRVQSKLDELARQFRRRPLTGRYQYLFLDAAYVKDLVGLNGRSICVLTAVAITFDGRKEILGFERVRQESTAHWSRFLRDLLERGLDRFALEMVISDEHKGLLAAVEEVLGDVPHQLCWAHRCRNLFKAVLKMDRQEMALGLRQIYQAANRAQALERFKVWKQVWQERYPNLVAGLEEDLGNLLAFLRCPQLHQKYVRTSNPIERTFLELRRMRFGCGAFANRESCDRVVSNVYRRLNEKWQDEDIWFKRAQEEKRRLEREKARAAQIKDNQAARLANGSDPVSGARVAPQQSPILPDGCATSSMDLSLSPA